MSGGPRHVAVSPQHRRGVKYIRGGQKNTNFWEALHFVTG